MPGGLVVVDKPGGMTSHDVVGRLRRLAHTRRVGHAGTLDPMATGVLLVGVGQATRLLHHLVLTDKAYTATIRLGVTTVTDDREGEVLTSTDAGGLDPDAIRAAAARFVGEIDQVPSAVSAVKVAGERAYDRVRAGEDVDLQARRVTVQRFDVLDVRPEGAVVDVDVDVEVSSGTYVRALARDLGADLGVGGHLTALRRTQVGPFTADRAVPLDRVAEWTDTTTPLTLTLEQAVRELLPVRVITAEEADLLSYGRFLPPVGIEGLYAVLLDDGTVIGLLREFDNHTARGGGFFARPVLIWHARG
ncbi:tRNA pseudouridine(55) synthase TruB [Jatrophihabitans sp. YIM 134969]